MKALVPLTMLALAACTNPAKAPKTLVGLWGGPGVNLNLEGGVGTVAFDCAAGTVDEAIGSAQGPFSIKGTYRVGQPGPVRVGQIFTAQEATYSGVITKEQMTLSVTLADGTELGPFQLAYGVPGTLNRCL